jgi:hypothetical protein
LARKVLHLESKVPNLMDEVDAGDALGDWVLHLKPGVHLEEVEVLLGVEQELDGAGRVVPDCRGQGDGLFAHGSSEWQFFTFKNLAIFLPPPLQPLFAIILSRPPPG